jgi:hypothetical protein
MFTLNAQVMGDWGRKDLKVRDRGIAGLRAAAGLRGFNEVPVCWRPPCAARRQAGEYELVILVDPREDVRGCPHEDTSLRIIAEKHQRVVRTL